MNKELTPEEKALVETIEAKVKSLNTEAVSQMIDKKEFEAKVAEIQSEINAVKESAEVESLKTALAEVKELAKNQGLEITKIKQLGSNDSKPKGFIDAVKELLNNADIKAYIDNGAKGNSVQVKTLVDITQATAITAGSTLPTQLLGGVPVYAPERKISMVDIISTGTTETETVTFNQEYEFEDGVTTLYENQSAGKSSFKVRPVSLTAGRIGTHVIVSKRSLKNEKYLLSHIASRIPQKIRKAEDAQILFGAGTGSSLTGLTINASAFAAGVFSGAVPKAQEYDALMVAISQLTQGNYEASGIVLNPIDATKIEMLKDTTGRYLSITRGVDGVLRISNIPVVESTAMTSGKFLVGDMKMACEFLYFTPLTMSMSDSHESLFLKNEVCILFEEEPVFPIYNPLMFVYGDFAVAIAAINDASA